jgi:chemosensory pili system protein ChpE
MLLTAFTGAIMAISFCAPPGPVAMETIRRGLRGGFGPALQVQLGSILGDMTWCALALLGLAPLVQVPWVRLVLSVAGVGVLVYLGGVGLRDAFKGMPAAVAASDQPAQARHGAFRSGVAISMANPTAVGYWLSVGGALVAAGVAGTTAQQTTVFVAGFVAGTVAWAFLTAFVVRWGRVLMTPRVFRLVNLGCSAALLVFGLSLALAMFSPSV